MLIDRFSGGSLLIEDPIQTIVAGVARVNLRVTGGRVQDAASATADQSIPDVF